MNLGTGAAALLALSSAPGAAGGTNVVSVHQQHRESKPAVRMHAHRERTEPTAATEFTTWVFGFYATFSGQLSELQWDRLTHVAIFDVQLLADGTLDNTTAWTDNAEEALTLAEPHDVNVYVTVTCFDAGIMADVLSDPTRRATAAEAMGQLVDDYGASGVTLDFEGMALAQREQLVTFVEELAQRVDEVIVATPAIDVAGAYDYGGLAAASEALFLMGYGYHWPGSNPGPPAPLYGGGGFGEESLEWSLEQHEAGGALPQNIILGLPLYGMEWATTGNNVPGTATFQGSSLMFTEAVAAADEHGRQFNDATQSPYYFATAMSQTWYDDTASLDIKIEWAIEQGVAGVGFWALNFEGGDPEFWDMVEGHTQTEVPGGSTSTGEVDDTTGGMPDPGTSTTTTGAGSSGPVDPTNEDSGSTTGTSGPAADPPAQQDEGCGCSADGPTRRWPMWAAFVMLWAARRRPRATTTASR